jgi:CDP-paratose 2-epimerase
MSIAVVTGSAGLIGNEAARFFAQLGMDVVGIDNDSRAYFFGAAASTAHNAELLQNDLKRYRHHNLDIRNRDGIMRLFRSLGQNVKLIVHTAAQPSHDWAAKEPFTDFEINATGTLNLLEATHLHCLDSVFIYTSTNKVYGDLPNQLPLIETASRWELPTDHKFYRGIDESLSIDQSTHSLFGVSKAAADLAVQEYGRYFGMNTACFRGGCLTGPNHSGAQLHGFLSYLVYCATTGTPYTIFGYKGKQVRDNIHSYDLITAFHEFFKMPRAGEVYNIGGGRFSNCSVLEAIRLSEEIANRPFNYTISDEARIGDHQWYISDLTKFREHYPNWKLTINVNSIIKEIYDANHVRWTNAKKSA